MKLLDLLSVLTSNKNLNATLVDDNDNRIITFDVSGYESIKDSLTDMDVKRIKLKTATQISIVLNTEVDPEPEPDPDPDPDDPQENIPYNEEDVPIDNPYSENDNN